MTGRQDRRRNRAVACKGLISGLVLLAALGLADAESFKGDVSERIESWIRERMIAERNVAVPMRDGLKLAANVYRPKQPGRYPVIMAFTPFNKDINWASFPFNVPPGYEPFGPTNMQGANLYTGTTFEANEPAFWVPYGYVVVIVDARGFASSPGTGFPEGFSDYGSVHEDAILSQGLWARDMYDAVEWAGTQDWSNGRVGLSGVSILAFSQWRAAALNPPHLKAIIPWEGMTDYLRDRQFRGGIPETGFSPPNFGSEPAWAADRETLPAPVERDEDEFLADIQVPALITATWSRHGGHSRGAFRAWRKISSTHKWLYTHGRDEWPEFYATEARMARKLFFDHFLKGIDDRILSLPRVRLAIRDTAGPELVRFENEFPLERTQYKSLYLDARSNALGFDRVPKATSLSYDAESDSGEAVFQHTFDTDTELTGYMSLRLWVEPESADDMDLFVTVAKLDADGNEVEFERALGWLRLSHRALDAERSTAWDPYQQRVTGEGDKVRPGEIVAADIAILPSSTLYRAGESLRLGVSGRFIGGSRAYRFDETVNAGTHRIHTGGEYDSALLVPVIPPE